MISSISQWRILIVNADASLRELLRYLLSSDGHDVQEAQGRQQALQKLSETTFDVVLTGSSDLDVKRESPFPQVEVHGEVTPVLRLADHAVSESEELRSFRFNPFDLVSIRQALEAIQHVAGGTETAVYN